MICGNARRYNTLMKLIFLASSLTIIYLMRSQKGIRQTYDREQDTFRTPFLLVPCALLALIFKQEFSLMEVPPPLLHPLPVLPYSPGPDRCASRRSCGRSPSSWRRSPSCHSWCCCSGRKTSTT